MRILIGVAISSLSLFCRAARAFEQDKMLEKARAEFIHSRCVYSELNPSPTLKPCENSGAISYFFYKTMNNTITEGRMCVMHDEKKTNISTDNTFKDPREQLRFLGYMHSFWMARKDNTRAQILTEVAAVNILRTWNQEMLTGTERISAEDKRLWAKGLKGEEREKVGRLIETCMPHKIDNLPYEVLSLMPSVEIKPTGDKKTEDDQRQKAPAR